MNEKPQPEKLNGREQAIITVTVAMEQFFPGRPPLPRQFAVAWLRLLSPDEVLYVIESCAERDAREPLTCPENFIFSQIQRRRGHPLEYFAKKPPLRAPAAAA